MHAVLNIGTPSFEVGYGGRKTFSPLNYFELADIPDRNNIFEGLLHSRDEVYSFLNNAPHHILNYRQSQVWAQEEAHAGSGHKTKINALHALFCVAKRLLHV